MHQTLPAQPAIPNAVIESVLGRLGAWESSVERPTWTIPYQQLGLAGSGPIHFTRHHDAPEQLLRFQGCQAERQFWLEQLPNIEPDIMRIARFRQCGAYSWVAQELDTGRYFLRGESCKLRICPVCRRRIQHRSSRRVLDFMDQQPHQKWQFHTFTLKHSKIGLRFQLERLVRSFRRLRQRKLWRDCVKTGYAVIEVTFHPRGSVAPGNRVREDSEWHPHLHVLAATDFIDWSKLRKDWKAVTGDSDNIDCQHVQSSSHAAHYVSKYIGKPPDLNLQSEPIRAAEYYHALESRRLLMPFGATSKHQLPKQASATTTQKVCRFSTLLQAAANGDYAAKSIVAYLILATVPRLKPQDHRQKELFKRHPP